MCNHVPLVSKSKTHHFYEFRQPRYIGIIGPDEDKRWQFANGIVRATFQLRREGILTPYNPEWGDLDERYYGADGGLVDDGLARTTHIVVADDNSQSLVVDAYPFVIYTDDGMVGHTLKMPKILQHPFRFKNVHIDFAEAARCTGCEECGEWVGLRHAIIWDDRFANGHRFTPRPIITWEHHGYPQRDEGQPVSQNY
jgi:hypothetical protein